MPLPQRAAESMPDDANRSTRSALVIGVQKAGTTLLHAVLLLALRLPNTHPAYRTKELHFFEDNDCSGSHRDTVHCKQLLDQYASDGWLVDGSPDYFQNAHIWGSLHFTLPRAALLITLRDPVDRAYAAWAQNQKGSLVPTEPSGDLRSFDRAVREELDDLWHRCSDAATAGAARPARASDLALQVAASIQPWYAPKGAVAALGITENGSQCLRHWRRDWLRWNYHTNGTWCGSCKQYLARGFVTDKLAAWERSFGGSVLVLGMEGVVADTPATASRIRRFLGLPTVQWSGESLAALSAIARRTSWHPAARRLKAASWSDGVLSILYREEVRRLWMRVPAIVDSWARWSGPDDSTVDGFTCEAGVNYVGRCVPDSHDSANKPGCRTMSAQTRRSCQELCVRHGASCVAVVYNKWRQCYLKAERSPTTHESVRQYGTVGCSRVVEGEYTRTERQAAAGQVAAGCTALSFLVAAVLAKGRRLNINVTGLFRRMHDADTLGLQEARCPAKEGSVRDDKGRDECT